MKCSTRSCVSRPVYAVALSTCGVALSTTSADSACMRIYLGSVPFGGLKGDGMVLGDPKQSKESSSRFRSIRTPISLRRSPAFGRLHKSGLARPWFVRIATTRTRRTSAAPAARSSTARGSARKRTGSCTSVRARARRRLNRRCSLSRPARLDLHALSATQRRGPNVCVRRGRHAGSASRAKAATYCADVLAAGVQDMCMRRA